jgi:hypothetical protein
MQCDGGPVFYADGVSILSLHPCGSLRALVVAMRCGGAQFFDDDPTGFQILIVEQHAHD